MPQSSDPQDTRLSSSPVLVYTLTGESAWDTDLVPFPRGGGPEYKVATAAFRGRVLKAVRAVEVTMAVTRVATTSGDVVATLEWRDTFPDKVTLRGGPEMSMNSWMRRVGSGIFRPSSAMFQDGQGRKYRWKKIAVWQQMELHAEDTPTGAIAAYSRGGVDPFTKVYTHGTLALTARALEIAELCVVSFLFLEKRRRLWERETEKQGDLAHWRSQIRWRTNILGETITGTGGQ